MKRTGFAALGAGAAGCLLALSPVNALEIKVGYTTTVSFEGRINTVTIGDPNIVEATVAFGNTLVLMGRAVGATNIVPLDDNGKEMTEVDVYVVPSTVVGRPIDIVHGVQVPRSFICYRNGCVTAPDGAAISGAGVAKR